MAGPNLLAHVLVSKFDDHLPLYRQHKIFERMGAHIRESTLVGWCGRAMKTLSSLIDADILGFYTRTIPRSGYWTVPEETKDWGKA
jgi:transposase